MKKFFIILFSVILLVLPFAVIGTVYCIGGINIFDNPDFWYGYMAYFGTVVLAAVAVWQNRIIKEENDAAQEKLEELTIQANEQSAKVIEMEQNRYRLELRPFVLVSNWEAYEIDSKELVDDPKEKYIQIGMYKTGKALGLALELTNTTQSCITVQYNQGIVRNPDLCWGNAAVNQENLKMTLAPGDTDKFIFYAPPKFMEKQISQRVTVELTLENRFSKRYKETFVIIITSLSDKVSQIPGKWHCHLFAQEYTIGRLEKDENGDPICIDEEL